MEKLLHEMHTWMNAYMRSFRTNDPEVMRGIQLKEIHTGYVTAHARALAKHLGCHAHDMAIAEIVGLFHDVGRLCPLSDIQRRRVGGSCGTRPHGARRGESPRTAE